MACKIKGVEYRYLPSTRMVSRTQHIGLSLNDSGSIDLFVMYRQGPTLFGSTQIE